MRKLTAILALGAILYSCTENDTPDQLNLEEQIANYNAPNLTGRAITQIPSQAPKGSTENAMIMASFTPIDDVSGDYTTETTLLVLDIPGILCGAFLSSVTDGTLTLDFDKYMNKRQAAICRWSSTFGTPPAVEGPNPHILFTEFQNSIGISLSAPVSTFGFELHPSYYDEFEYQVSFYNDANLIGSITRTVSGLSGGAKLFAATTDASFDYVVIEALSDSGGFAIGQFRYAMEALEGENPFTLDIKPDSCKNPVNFKSRGMIPVGILAASGFDVNDIDLSTVRLNGVAPKKASIADLGGYYEKGDACDCDPTDMDGVMDLNLKFDTQAIVASLGDVSDGETVTVSVSFDTMDGTSWSGEDCIWIIKKGGEK